MSVIGTRHAGVLALPRDPPPREEIVLLTESEVQRSFRGLLKNWNSDPEASRKAENLLDHLRPESPLRHRLTNELDEVRRLQEASA